MAVARTITRFGKLDALFANAGVLGEFKPLAVTEAEEFDALIATNLRGTFFTIKQCLPVLADGAILINASWTAGGVMSGAGAYAGTKGALQAMMRTLAVEQGPRNIRVNSINPGIILTPMADDVIDPVFAARLASHTPLRRNGRSEDVAGIGELSLCQNVLQSWLTVLANDKRAIFQAAAHAQRAVSFLHSLQSETDAQAAA
ncbi:SDR family NAD(P)-dependent oxidoreductase [Rhizobium mongolense]|uniref:SDR family NAD(P)-dependent oxidoreductase n=1 Tax=Rhizobium mongolense TaxID=57676 RepID=UPI001613E6D2|nr:SDR family oxidoreductase [Rhizobium mongolense]